MDKWQHNINENSSMFQGHVDQLFSLNKLGFRIKYIYCDQKQLQEVNYEHYKRSFITTINKLLQKRGDEGFEYEKINDLDNGLKFLYPKITDADISSGDYELYPKTAICPKCHRYIRLDHPEDVCSCNVKLSQFTFIAFCDDCGAHYPIDAMSNIFNDCKKCGYKQGLRNIYWNDKDDISSYSVSCVNCGYKERLVIYKCDHKDHQTGKIRSNKPKSKFRAVAARAGAILNPMVLTSLNIPQISTVPSDNEEYKHNQFLISSAFNYFFKNLDPNIQESLLYIPDFFTALINEKDFWIKPKIIELTNDMNLHELEFNSWTDKSKSMFIQQLLKDAKDRVNISNNELEQRKNYGIDIIEKCLNDIGKTNLDEREQQGMYLLRVGPCSDKKDMEVCAKRIPESDYPDGGIFLKKLGIESVVHISNLEILQSLLGVVEGSMRREPKLFRTITDSNKKPIVYIRKTITEGIYFKFDSKKILTWLYLNKKIDTPSFDKYNDALLRKLVSGNDQIRSEVYKLIHTFSHALIQNASIYTGLETQSISEMLFPSFGMILLYSTNPVNVGGLEYTYDNLLYEWLQKVKDLTEECPQDPACMLDEGGSCMACLFLPEFVCENFNEELDRDCLIGEGKVRYEKGFLNVE